MEYFFNFEKIAYLKGKRPEECILCLIRDGSDQVENLSVYENDLFNVSVNLYPYNSGHLLLFPRRHVEDIRELTPEEEQIQQRLIRILLDVLERC